MVEGLIGIPFILLASAVITTMIMALWYHLRENAETARALSAISILLIAPIVTVATMQWRWGEIDDSPAAGIPFVIALYEMFWIWCASLVLLFVLHGPLERFFEARRRRKEIDLETFE